MGSPQPVLAASNSQKNINMVKALQQINQMLNTQGSITSLSLSSNQQAFTQPNLKTTHSTKNLMLPQHQSFANPSSISNPIFSTTQLGASSGQYSSKSIKPTLTGSAIVQQTSGGISSIGLNLPHSQKNSTNQNLQKLKQVHHKASGSLLQKSESHQSLLQFQQANKNSLAFSSNQKSKAKPKNTALFENAQNRELNAQNLASESLSPKSEFKHSSKNIQKQIQLQKTHNRQMSTIVNFNLQSAASTQGNFSSNFGALMQQTSIPQNQLHSNGLSPINKANYQSQNYQLREQDNERKSVERLNINNNYSQERLNTVQKKENESRGNGSTAAQVIKVSPHKQFIVQSCSHTQQTSPQQDMNKAHTKLQLNNPRRQKSNLILEQEDYLLPVTDQDEDNCNIEPSLIVAGIDIRQKSIDEGRQKFADFNQYSLRKDYQNLVNSHNQKMLRGGLVQSVAENARDEKQFKESEESINKGFMTDRRQSASNPMNHGVDGLLAQQQMTAKQKKTKGISYTRNAQELKKLLLETGVIGNLGLTSSLATAAAGLISSTQDTLFMQQFDMTQQNHLTGSNTNPNRTVKSQQKSNSSKVKNSEIFSFTSKGKSSKLLTNRANNKYNIQEQAQASSCLMQTQSMTNNRLKRYNEKESFKGQQPNDICYIPDSTKNKVREYIEQYIDDEGDVLIEATPDKIYENFVDDQFHQQSYIPWDRNKNIQHGDNSSQLNFPHQETDKLFLINKRAPINSENPKSHDNQHSNYKSMVSQNKENIHGMTRCWTQIGDISTERIMLENGQYILKERREMNNNHYSTEGLEESRIDSMGEAPINKYKSTVSQNSLRNNLQPNQNSNLPNMKSSRSNSSHKIFANLDTERPQITGTTYRSNQPRPQQTYDTEIKDLNSALSMQKNELTLKEMEVLKFKMIAFVKTYENQFSKMKMQINDLQSENSQLKKKLNVMQSRKMSATTNSGSGQNFYQKSASHSKVGFYQESATPLGANHPNTCLTSVQTSQLF